MDAAEYLVEKLLEGRKRINELYVEEQKLREALLPLLSERKSIQSKLGRVYYTESRGARRFSRTEVLAFIRDTFGAGMANMIDEACTNESEPRQTVNVQLRRDQAARDFAA